MKIIILSLFLVSTLHAQIVNVPRPEVGQIGITTVIYEEDQESGSANIYGKEYKIWAKVIQIVDQNNVIVDAKISRPHPRSGFTRRIWIRGMDTSKMVDDCDVDIGDLNVKVSKTDSDYGNIFLFEIIDKKVIDDIVDKKKQNESDKKELQEILSYLRKRSTDKKINEMIDRAITISKKY